MDVHFRQDFFLFSFGVWPCPESPLRVAEFSPLIELERRIEIAEKKSKVVMF